MGPGGRAEPLIINRGPLLGGRSVQARLAPDVAVFHRTLQRPRVHRLAWAGLPFVLLGFAEAQSPWRGLIE